MARISWDEYFMSMAELASKRSTCLRRHVGAVIVRDNQVLSTGLPNCCDLNECLRQKLGIPSGERHELCRAVHAEANAITQCAVNGTSCKGSTLYVTATPCIMCTKQIINAGIVRIVAEEMYPDEMSLEMLKQSGISFEMFTKEEEK